MNREERRIAGVKALKTTVALLLILVLFLAAGYSLLQLIYRLAGKVLVEGVASHIISGLLGIFLLIVAWVIFAFFFHNKDSLRRGSSKLNHRDILENTLDALNRIAQGDFDVLITTNYHGPYYELAESVNKMAKELGSMENLRQDFISNVSHEINSPLTSISGFAALMKKGGLEQEQICRYARIIETEALRLSNLSDNLLKLSALETDVAPLNITLYRLDKQIENIFLMMEPQWMAKNITPEVDLCSSEIMGDEDLLSQVWINLIHNAVKFTPENGSIIITLDKNPDDEYFCCTIKDTGPGIAPEDQVHIFERFYKADKSRDRALGGNGLGLSLVKKIVALHHGKINVQSELGKGTVFTVVLPVNNSVIDLF